MSRRLFLIGTVASVGLVGASRALAQALPQTNFESFAANAFDRYVSRVNTAGLTPAANDNHVRYSLSQRLVALAPRGTALLKIAGRFAGPIGLAFVLVDVLKAISADDDGKAGIASVELEGGSMPGNYATIRDAMADGEKRLYMDGSTPRYFWRTNETTSRPSDYYGPNWSRQLVTNMGGGVVIHLWEWSGTSEYAWAYTPPTEAYEDVVEDLEAVESEPLRQEDLAALLNQMLADAHAIYPSWVPDPATHPLTTADLATDTLTVGDLITESPLDRDLALGEVTNPTGGGSGGDTFPEWPEWDETLEAPAGLTLPALSPPSMQIDQPSTCPKVGGTWHGETVEVDPCPMLEDVSPLVSAVMPLVYAIGALKIMFFNGK